MSVDEHARGREPEGPLPARRASGRDGTGRGVELSIVIVNYRTWDDLDVALASLRDGAPPSWEIIVVDNASGDGRLDEFARAHPEATFVASSQNAGFARGCNLGAREARGEMLLFMNPDVVATPGAVAKLIEEKRAHPDVAILTARQLDARGRRQKAFDMFPDLLTYFGTVRAFLRWLRPARYPDARADFEGLVYCDWVSGSVLLIDRAEFTELGGWCEDFWMYSEDVDLCRRVTDRGRRVAMVPAVELVHRHGSASRSSESIAVATKLEAIISKHVYNRRHCDGVHRWLNTGIIASRNVGRLFASAVASVVLLSRSRRLNQRRGILVALLAYYVRVAISGSWLSERADAAARADMRGEQSPHPTK